MDSENPDDGKYLVRRRWITRCHLERPLEEESAWLVQEKALMRG
jgi:hypothetical protein